MLLDYLSLEQVSGQAPVTPVTPPPHAVASGGPPYARSPKRVEVRTWRYDLQALQALYAAGELDEDEYAALLADARETVVIN